MAAVSGNLMQGAQTVSYATAANYQSAPGSYQNSNPPGGPSGLPKKQSG